MKLRELNEDYTEDDVKADAKKKFINKLTTELQKVLANPNITQVTTPAATAQNTTPAPNIAQQAAQTRQQKQSMAAQTAQSQMAQNPAKPKVWRSGRNPNGPAFARENTEFQRLNSIFESIINVAEEASPQVTTPLSINDLITTNFMKIMNAPYIFNPRNTDTLPIIQKFAKEIEDTIPIDGGEKAMWKLGDWAWDTLSEIKHKQAASRWGVNTNMQATPKQPTAQPTPQPTAQPTTQVVTQPTTQSNIASPEVQQSKVGVRQINKLIPTLRKRDLLSVKKNVDNTLAGKSSIEPKDTGKSAFGQMAGQLAGSNKKSSTGGTITKTPTGQIHTAKPQQSPAQTAPEKDNIISMPKGKAGKVRASREGGVTPEEQAKFDEKVRQAMASQKD